MSRIPYDPPVQPGISCTNCGSPLQANARVVGSLEIQGLHGYEWVHADSGIAQCRPITTARPYDGWAATRSVDAVLAARRAIDRALEEALSDGEVTP